MRLFQPGTTGHRLWWALAGWPRWVAVGLLLCAAAVSMVLPAGPGVGGPLTSILVADHPLAAGSMLGAGSLRLARWPASIAPQGTYSTVQPLAGRRIAAQLDRGEPITKVKLLATVLSDSLHQGQVAVSVAISGTAGQNIIFAGSRVDLYAVGDEGRVDGVSAAGTTGATAPAASAAATAPAATAADTAAAAAADVAAATQRIATDVRVLAVFADANASDPAAPVTLVVACDDAAAGRLARVGAGRVLASLRPT